MTTEFSFWTKSHTDASALRMDLNRFFADRHHAVIRPIDDEIWELKYVINRWYENNEILQLSPTFNDLVTCKMCTFWNYTRNSI